MTEIKFRQQPFFNLSGAFVLEMPDYELNNDKKDLFVTKEPTISAEEKLSKRDLERKFV